MITIVDDYFKFYEIFKTKYSELLQSNNVRILSEFLDNKKNIIEFHKKYIQPNRPEIVICGVNPGRFGAGLTGIPFIDFDSLSKMLPRIKYFDSEKSAKFFFSVVQAFGIEQFYQKFHVTNISWYGFSMIDKEKNVNYYNLPVDVQKHLFEKFVEEMNFINPKIIIPLSKDVQNQLLILKSNEQIKAEITPNLNHPSWVMTYKRNEVELWKEKYIHLLKNI